MTESRSSAPAAEGGSGNLPAPGAAETLRQSCPQYRVRLFLSVDLAGSTAYKYNKEAEGENPLAWVKAFEEFYRIFPETLEESYRSAAKEPRQLAAEEITAGCPQFWKRVGDEILFCCRIYSLCHLGLCLDAFIRTLQEYASRVKANNLSVKGNAWVASFPLPNVVFRLENEQESDYLLDERAEREVDARPHLFDFLGKEIDAGFRIAVNSSPDEMTVSPALAYLLCEAVGLKSVTRYSRPIRLKEMQAFKGVAENEPYPVLVLDAGCDAAKKQLKQLERRLLAIPDQADNEILRRYLKEYLKEHQIQVPKLPFYYGADTYSEPGFYRDFRARFDDRAELNEAEDCCIIAAAKAAASPADCLAGPEAEARRKMLLADFYQGLSGR